MNLPRARREDLLTTELDDEVVIYDPERKRAHCLNQAAVAVWNHCDGVNTIADIQRLVCSDIGIPITEEGVSLALGKLERARLFVENQAPDGMTRRHMMARAGQVLGATLAIPIVVSAFVPTAAAAASTDRREPTNEEGDDPSGADRD
jgi:Coenzyme PQQ synthesis protein D (PqqD)